MTLSVAALQRAMLAMSAELPCVFPFTLDAPEEPVTTPFGHTFERSALEMYRTVARAGMTLCPLCQQPLANEDVESFGLRINTTMRNMIEGWEQMRQQAEAVAAAAAAGRNGAEGALPTYLAADFAVSPGLLGRGSYAKVRQATRTLDGLAVAVKQADAGDDAAQRATRRELAALHRLSHPHVVQLLGTVDDAEGRKLWLMLELAVHGSLRALLGDGLARCSAFGDEHALPGATRTFYRLLGEIACALAFLVGAKADGNRKRWRIGYAQRRERCPHLGVGARSALRGAHSAAGVCMQSVAPGHNWSDGSL
mmetsp:Transcript_37544/g.92951  ORF Transcript_37544/g.92951 Transcript_37544/m.92951 type:complete len:310 (-) Transcript_37544:129-1058(-)